MPHRSRNPPLRSPDQRVVAPVARMSVQGLQTWNYKDIGRYLVELVINLEFSRLWARVLRNTREWIVKAQGLKLMAELASDQLKGRC